jgi:DNA polymerase IV
VVLAAPRLCCLDLDTFFVSVERLLDPTLARKVVVVGGIPGQRGVVTSASYEARALGVKSGMPLTEAFKLAPNAVYLPTRHGVYGEYSERVRRIAENYTPVSQIASIDEMFLDFSGCENLYHIAEDRTPDATIERTVRRLTDEIQDRDESLGGEGSERHCEAARRAAGACGRGDRISSAAAGAKVPRDWARRGAEARPDRREDAG